MVPLPQLPRKYETTEVKGTDNCTNYLETGTRTGMPIAGRIPWEVIKAECGPASLLNRRQAKFAHGSGREINEEGEKRQRVCWLAKHDT
jgi:hypothetical protein